MSIKGTVLAHKKGRFPYRKTAFDKMAPQAGFEPATRRLTAVCSATELLGNVEGFYRPGRLKSRNGTENKKAREHSPAAYPLLQ